MEGERKKKAISVLTELFSEKGKKGGLRDLLEKFQGGQPYFS